MRFKSIDSVRICIVLAVIVAGTAMASADSPAKSAPEFSPCQLTPPGGSTSIQATCGEIVVPENPADPNGKQISLRVVIVPAKHRNKAPDPMFLLAGGPGQAITEAYPAVTKGFGKIQEDRDIILVDQRGTGGSNPLECTSPDDIQLTEEETVALLQDCPNKLGSDPAFYTTEYFIQDLDYVREVLGYEQINLYGGSYGTRAAQAYLRKYPNRVRSMILDGVTPWGYRVFYDFRDTVPRAIQLVLDRCAEDPDCSEAFPDLRNEFLVVLDRLKAEPAQVRLSDSKTGEPVDITLTHDKFLRFVMPLLYAPETVALLPLTIHIAYEYADYTPLTGQAASTDMGIHSGVMFAVTCVEDIPFIPDESEWAERGPFDYSSHTRMMCDVCRGWDVPDNLQAVIPTESNVPVLLLSGEADPVTPPEQAEKARAYLTNSLHIVVPNMGHGMIARGCVEDVAAEFVKTATVTGIDVSCAMEILPQPFFVNLNGPMP